MGGLDRHGSIVTGIENEIKNSVTEVLVNSPNDFILGANCTLPGDIEWKNIKFAIQCSHEYLC